MAAPLYQLIEENNTSIVERFVAEVRQHDLPPRPMGREEVINHLYRYLAEMVGALRDGRAEQVKDSATAKEHGQHRWYAGYDLKRVVVEYGLLRKVIVDVITSLEPSLTLAEFDPLADFINVGVAEAAAEFASNSTRQISEALESARSATRAREDVMAIVSHDLKNPLNVVYGNVQFLLLDIRTGDLNAKRDGLRHRLEATQRAADKMNRLIMDMLDLARIKAGETRLKLAETTITELLCEAFEGAQTLAEQRAIRLIAEATGGDTLCCDKERILQVLQNLIGNAIKFGPEGSSVSLRAECSGEHCTFEVRDTGLGIPPEKMPFLFRRFWQEPDTAAQGTGLGLSIAKGLVELHGGRIWAESEPGRGTSFFFELPRRPKSAS